MNTIFEIRFSRSNSKNMNDADDLACRMGAKQRGLKYHIEFADIKDVFSQWENINALLAIIDKWKGFEIYYNGFLCPENKEYKTLFYSIQDVRKCYFWFLENSNINTSCHYTEFACAKLDLLKGFKKWYNYGHTTDFKTWIIDKQLIIDELNSCIKLKKLDSCPVFDFQKVIERLNEIPDKILLDGNWELLYIISMEGDKMVKRPIDIKPTYIFGKKYDSNELREVPMYELINQKLISLPDKIEITQNKLVFEFLGNKFREN